MTLFLIIIGLGILLCLGISLICFFMAFYVPKPKNGIHQDVPLPDGEIYEPYHEQMAAWAQNVSQMPHEHFTIQSFDGLTLHGNFYEYTPGAPIELMFHGYRGSAKRDLSGGVARCFALKRSCLIVDQRCAGRSEGTVITFGIREHQDCLNWVDFMVNHFGPDVKIILTGISMGAATVLMAAGKPLPSNVIGVLADCGYSSPEAIIKCTIQKLHLPPNLLYPFVKLAAKLFGGFDLEEYSPIEAMKTCTLPVIFFHGEADNFVPCYMSQENFEACTTRKALCTVPEAGHGLCFPAMQEWYIQKLGEFFGPEASAQ